MLILLARKIVTVIFLFGFFVMLGMDLKAHGFVIPRHIVVMYYLDRIVRNVLRQDHKLWHETELFWRIMSLAEPEATGG